MGKRCLSLLLAVLMMCSLWSPAFAAEGEADVSEVPAETQLPAETELPAGTAAPEEETGPADGREGSGAVPAFSGRTGSVNWSFSGGVLHIVGHGPMAEGYSAGGSQPWEAYREQITGLDIASGVTAIGAYAFKGCVALAEVTLPESVVRIGEGAFSGTNMRDIVIPNAACEISRDALALGRPGLTVIHGCAGSAAQTYAQVNGYRFAPLASADEPVPAPVPAPIPAAPASATDAVTDPASATDAAVATPGANSSAEASKPNAPVLIGATSAATGVTIQWNALAGAVKYRVLYKIGTGSWKKLADTKSTSYTWTKAKANTDYSFTVRCVSSNGRKYTSDFDPVGVSRRLLSTPSVTVTGGTDAVTVSWKAVSGAAKYRVFLKNGKNWDALEDVEGTSYTMAAQSGKSYTFTVRCLDANGDYASGYNTSGKKISFVSAPKISSVGAAATGVTVKWSAVAGAAKYRVFYKIGTGSWKKLVDTKSSSYTWTKAKVNTNYSFTVRCLSSNGKKYTSTYDTTGVSFRLLSAPSVTVTGGTDVIKVSWKAVSGAAKYRVLLKNGKNWDALEDVEGTSYTMAAQSGKSYTFTVRCLDAAGNFASGYNTSGKKISFVSAPKVSSVGAAAAGLTVKWGAVAGAAKYRVFYKIGIGSWKKLADTKNTSYTWTKAKVNTNYSFTVRCLSSNGKKYTSTYDTAGISFRLLSTPSVSVAHGNNSITVSWKAVAGAAKYRVFLKNGKNWDVLTDMEQTSYIIPAQSGRSYTFTVRCLDAAGNYVSGYDTSGETIAFVEPPVLDSVEAAAGGIAIKWGAVANAAKYRILYKTGSGSWKKLIDTKGTSYTWTGAKSGTEYTFTVRCLSSDGKSYTSAYDETGRSVFFFSAPKLTKVANVTDGFKMTWGAVTGAVSYRVWYQVDAGDWAVLAETDKTSYTVTGVDSKAKYALAVQAVAGNGTVSARSEAWKTMVFTNSPLVSCTKISPNRDKDRKNIIDTITIHCVVGQCSVETLGDIFAPKSKAASSNYGIGYDGRVGMYVEEKDCSWCSSNRTNDNRAITIEVASDTYEPYRVNAAAYETLIDLVTDICQRNGIEKLVWSTKKNERVNHLNGCNMTVHRDYANKSCPGTYLYERMGKIAAAVNARLAS